MSQAAETTQDPNPRIYGIHLFLSCNLAACLPDLNWLLRPTWLRGLLTVEILVTALRFVDS